MCFQTAPSPRILLGDEPLHHGPFALNAASVAPGRVLATVPLPDGREAVLAWDVSIGQTGAPEVP